MGSLIYFVTTSLDGYMTDATGSIDWSDPSDDVQEFVNDSLRPVGTFLFGRRMYEAMLYWEAPERSADDPQGFLQTWQAADKVVFSTTLDAATSSRTRLERELDPDAIRRLKAGTERDITVGGAHLAEQALKAGLVDELKLFVVPILLGGGTRALPDGLRLPLELRDERRFASGTMYLNYRVLN